MVMSKEADGRASCAESAELEGHRARGGTVGQLWLPAPVPAQGTPVCSGRNKVPKSPASEVTVKGLGAPVILAEASLWKPSHPQKLQPPQ